MLAMSVMLVVLILAAVMNVAVVWANWRRTGHHPFRIPHYEGPTAEFSPVVKHRGGAKVGLIRESWPLTTFEADSDWLRVSTIFRRIWIPRSRVTAVAWDGLSVRFRSEDGAFDGVTLWTTEGLVRDLFAMGWPPVPRFP